MKTGNIEVLNNKIDKRFLELAHLLNDIMGDEIYPDITTCSPVPNDIIEKTAMALKDGYESGDFTEDENGMLYYSGMIDDYGGLLDKFYQSA